MGSGEESYLGENSLHFQLFSWHPNFNLTLAPSSVLSSFHACQLFTKLVHTENFSSARKTLKKHAQSSLRMMEKNAGQGSLKVPRESLSAGISLKLQGVTFYYCD